MKKIILIFIILISAHLAFAQDSPWPTFHGNDKRDGLSSYDTTHINGTVKWIFKAQAAIESSPAIGNDGTVYFGSHDGYFYAVDKEGILKWKIKIATPKEKKNYNTQIAISSSPAIAKDGTIHVASHDQNLYAISSDGNVKWKFPMGFAFDSWSSPVIGKDGTIYLTSSPPKGGLIAITPQGKEKWYYSTKVRIFNSPALDKQGNIYVGFPTGFKTNELLVFDSQGNKKWSHAISLFFESTPAIGKDGTVYLGSFTEGKVGAGVYALSQSGEKWYLSLDTKEVMSTPAVTDKMIYFG